MTGTIINTLSTVGISLSLTADNPVTVESMGGVSVTSGLYALAGQGTAGFVPSSFTITNYGVISDTAPNSFGVTLSNGGVVDNTAYGFPHSPVSFGTISGYAHGIAITDRPGYVYNSATIQATATSGVAVGLYAGGNVSNDVYQEFPRGPGDQGVIKGAVRITGGKGTVENSGLLGVGASTGVYLGAGGYVRGGNFTTAGLTGTISGTRYGIAARGGSTTVADYGVIIGGTAAVSLPAGYDNRLRLYPGASIDGSVNGGNTVGATSSSTLELLASGASGASTLGLGGLITNFGTVSFDLNARWFFSDSAANIAGGQVFQNFAVGDTLNITGITGETIAGFNAGTLSLGGSAPLDIVIAATATAANFEVFNDPSNGTDIITNLASQPCFAAGTRILTDRGEISVDRVHAGDRVVTVMRGGIAAVVWIGRRRVWPRRHPRTETVQPVMIRPDAFGSERPHRSLRLSPDHAVFVDGVLIPVGLLINGHSIVREDVIEVTYYHLELSQHDVLYAEGMTCESYLATGSVAAFDNSGVTAALHPAFAPAAIWETMGCAPLIRCGARLDHAREKLSARADDATRRARRRAPRSDAYDRLAHRGGEIEVGMAR